MKKGFMLVFLITLSISPVVSSNSISSSQVAFCEHMGYHIEINQSSGSIECIFFDGSRCDATRFYEGSCGEEKILAISPRKEGEKVYLEFEKCEEGLSIKPSQYLLDLPECYRPTIIDKIWGSISRLLT